MIHHEPNSLFFINKPLENSSLFSKSWLRLLFQMIVAITITFSLNNIVPSHAQTYPNKPIKLIISFPPGDSIDVVTRMISPRLGELLGQPVVIENMPGGSGQIGLAALARANPDGYTIGSVQVGSLIVLPLTNKNVKYEAVKSFSPIAISMKNFQGIVANTNAPFNNLKEMVAYAKANPGKLSVATNGEGGYPHLTFEDFRSNAQFDYLHIPYKGSVQVVTDLLSGQVQVGILGLAPFVTNIRAGKLKLLGITYPTTVPNWPQTSLANEVVPDFKAEGWFGYAAPSGTPKEIIQRLNVAINTAMNEKNVIDYLRGVDLIVDRQSPEFFENIIFEDTVRYKKIIQNIHFQPQ